MKGQSLFFWDNVLKCRLLKVLPSLLNVKVQGNRNMTNVLRTHAPSKDSDSAFSFRLPPE